MPSTDFEAARRNMIEYQVRCCKVLDPIVLNTLASMPREDFLPEHVRSLAYMEGRVPLPCGQEMMSPLQEAYILQDLELQGAERVLEIGTGTGYLTALLAMHAKEVVSYEIHEELAKLSRTNLQLHGVENATVVHANAMAAQELDQAGTFDAVVIGATLEHMPTHILELVNEDGQIIAFIGTKPVVSLLRLTRTGNAWKRMGIFETVLQEMEGLTHKREFIF
ncbi:MAG: protein-L-isoaspartate O-methyltransferase [Mariprofundaceae bacterium]